MQTLTFQPLMPIALWVTLAACAALLLVIYGRESIRRIPRPRWWAIMMLMTLAVALPLGILLNPLWLERIPPPEGKPLLTMLVDASASMATRDGTGAKSRFQEAASIAADLARQSGGRFEIETRTFTVATTPIDLQQLPSQTPAGAFTDLATAIDEVLRADRPQGQAVLLLSDGIHNAGGGEARVLDSAMRAKAVAAPIYTKTLGGAASILDLAVDVRSPQDLAYVGQQVPIRVVLSSQGLGGGTARVSLWHEEKQVDQRQMILTADKPSELEFQVGHDKNGLYRYEVRAEPLAEEATQVNNAATYILRVVDEPIRVLLLEGKPYWDTKFLTRILSQDPSIELVSIVRLAEGRFLERTLRRVPPETDEATNAADEGATTPTEVASSDGVPTEKTAPAVARPESWKILADASQVLADPDSLSKYQVVILGRNAEVFLPDPALAQLRRWLARDAGALVCFRGSPTAQISQRLGSLMPVRWNAGRESRFRMRLTASGRELRWLPGPQDPTADALAPLPTLATVSQPGEPQPQAVIWATGETSDGGSTPAVTSLPYGTGRVVVIEGAGMWRWAFLAPQYQQHQQIYGALWHSLTRWLVSNTGLLPTQTHALRSDKIRFTTTEAASASLLIRESANPVPTPLIELTGGVLTEPRSTTPVAIGDEPGTYRAAFGKLPEGRYTARIAGSSEKDASAQTVFDVRSNVDELTELNANPNLMQRLAVASGGTSLKSATSDELVEQLEAHLARIRPEQVRTTSAWDRWWVLVGVFSLWTAAWGLRRATGLV